MRAFGADDGKPNRTPPAWMKPLAPPVPSPVLSAGHISRTLLGHSCQAPTNGRNKLFYFFAFDGFNDRKYTRGSVNHTVPTLPERQGDFSDLLAISAPKYQLYDPLSVHPDPTRPGHFIRDPITGNVIPKNRI